MKLFRVTQARHADTAFSGEGARRYGARWNSSGTPMVYTSTQLSLAILEILVHVEDLRSLDSFVVVPAEIPDELILQLELPAHWRDPSGIASKRAGDAWIKSGSSLGVLVPSVIVPLEFNILINPIHVDIKHLKLGELFPFEIDPRLKR